MSSPVEKILYRKAALIFEELGFMLPCSDDAACAEMASSARVNFNGPFGGCLVVSVSSEIFPMLSENMLGSTDPDKKFLNHDALCEFANVICGNALPDIYGVDHIFHLEAPILSEGNGVSALSSDYNKTAQVRIGFNNGSAEITLFVKNGQ